MTSTTPNRVNTAPSTDTVLLFGDEDILDDDMVRSIAGEDDLTAIRSLEFRISLADETHLPPLGTMCPKLTKLKLNGSDLPQLRVLGTSFSSTLTILYINNCNVVSLDGVHLLAHLQELYASFNEIKDLSPLLGMEFLSALDFEGNPIPHDSEEQLDVVRRLAQSTPSLQCITLPRQFAQHTNRELKAAGGCEHVTILGDDVDDALGEFVDDEIQFLTQAIRKTRDVGVEVLAQEEARAFEVDVKERVQSRAGSRGASQRSSRPPSARLLRPGSASKSNTTSLSPTESNGVLQYPPTAPVPAPASRLTNTVDGKPFSGNLVRALRGKPPKPSTPLQQQTDTSTAMYEYYEIHKMEPLEESIGYALNNPSKAAGGDAAGSVDSVLLREVMSWKEDNFRKIVEYDKRETNVLNLEEEE
eukprot:PhF_6_TR43520/c0_g1_i1/m.66804